MRRSALTVCWLACVSFVLAPLAMVHAHVAGGHDPVVVHGGHDHGLAGSDHHHRHDNRSVHGDHDTDASAERPIHFVGHIVHCDVKSAKPDLQFVFKIGAASKSPTFEPPAAVRDSFSSIPRDTEFIVHRAYLHPPLRGPPAIH